jgi:hypothetical protein
VLGTLLAVCAGCTGAQLYPKRALCPDDAIKAMRANGLECGHLVFFNANGDPNADEAPYSVHTSGALTAVVPNWRPATRTRWPVSSLPPGTRLYGQLWATPGYDEDLVVIRFDRVKTPDNKEFPVCFEGWLNGNVDNQRRLESGAVELRQKQSARVACEWHDPSDLDSSL